MAAGTTHDYLIALKNVILKERQCAIQLDLDGMYSAMNEKEEIIRILAHTTSLDAKDKPLAAEIRHENRRNAYLFKSTLGWIRETMEFFGKKTVTTTYSAHANSVNSDVNGRLLSGRI
jgi:hypothetical protein